MNPQKTSTCFVISPIGDKGSDIRKHADDLFELLIEPALEKFSFLVLRADKITSVESINKDVIEQIQNSDLCIIDITGHNPNVMYECGRRHETGKPYIMVAAEGEKLPFDITTIRTIFYNLNSGRDIRTGVKAIQDAVSRIVADGFQAESSGESLSSLADAVRRIERTLDRIAASGGTPAQSKTSASPRAAQLIKQYGPISAINYASSQRDSDLVDEILPRIPKKLSDHNYVLGGLAQGAAIGSRVALDILSSCITNLDGYSPEEMFRILGGYVSGSARHGESEKALEMLEPYFKEASEGRNPLYTAEDRASTLNQKQRLLHTLGRKKESLEIGERVLDLCPNEVSFLYNQSINYGDDGNDIRTLEMVDRYMALITNAPHLDEDHLERAVKVYAKAGENAKALAAFKLLQEHHPFMADALGDDSDIKPIFG